MNRRDRPSSLLLRLLASAVVSVSACGGAGPSNAPSPPNPAASVLLADLNAWIRFRLLYGLRADADWVVSVANHPDAVGAFGPPLLPAEVQHVLDAQADADRLVLPARRYGSEFSTDFVGVWIEGPVVVLAFSDHAAERRAEVATLFGDSVVVREARYSNAQLESFVNVIDEARGPNADACGDIVDDEPLVVTQCDEDAVDWFETIGAEVVQVRVDPAENLVYLSYVAPNEGVEARILEHFDAGEWLRFDWFGPPDWTGAYGDLEVIVIDRAGRPVPFLLTYVTEDSRVLRGDGPWDARDGRFLNRFMEAVEWELTVRYMDAGEEITVVRTVSIRPDELERVRLVVP